MILRALPTSVHSNTRLELQVWTQHGKADFGNYIYLKKDFSNVFSQSRLFNTLHNCRTTE